ncbi:protein meaA [bacterium]|nr:protein meaA [bacterium]|tara:strand:- start:1213 stop:3204 length:1992 start_codon:yes stop_codon:yes gene_type:complete
MIYLVTTSAMSEKKQDRPWIMRTYAGHTTAEDTNKLFKTNLSKGQTGLSVAFDLPTQTGYDSDHVLASGEVGKVGVPISNLSDMEKLFDDIPLDKMNTSMTINSTAAWLLALYCGVAKKNNIDLNLLQGTTQNDLLKEYLSRGTYIFPPKESIKIISDMIIFCYKNIPKWNPTNICSYHLQEAGATPVQELAFALCNAICILDSVKDSGQIPEDDFQKVVGRISFFVNAGIRFIEELCKMRAFTEMWEEICTKRYGVKDPKYKRFRYGVQVNSLGLTAQQPENNVARIIIEMLAVTLSKSSRARAIQLPGWNEALGLPRPWDQQWSLRFQQILAFETDLLEYEDVFEGSKVIDDKVKSLKKEAYEEIKKIDDMGGAAVALENGYMKEALVASLSRRSKDIEDGIKKVVGVNCYTETEDSELGANEAIHKIDETTVTKKIESLINFKKNRDNRKVLDSLEKLKESVVNSQNIMDATIECVINGVTTGEWAEKLREVFGEYRPPTGTSISTGLDDDEINKVRSKVSSVSEKLGRPIKILIGKPGLDGHSNGAEQIAVRARDVGMEVIYHGIRLTPDEIVSTIEQENVDLVGLSILSGSHLSIVPKIIDMIKERGFGNTPLIVGGIIPDEDHIILKDNGVKAVYTPKDYSLNQIMTDFASLVEDNI